MHFITRKKLQIKIFLSCILIYTTSIEAQEPPGLTAALKQHLKLSNESSAPKFQYSVTDLNGDGKDEVIVLITDEKYCGSGGCTMEVFHAEKGGFIFISGSTIVKPPIQILNSMSHGWKNIAVSTGKIRDVILKFNGKAYPLNPSLQPKATQQELMSAVTIIETY